MWDSRLVTTLYLEPNSKEETVVRKITEKVFEDHDDQELYHKETLAWVPEGTSAKDLNLMTAAPELLKALTELLDQLKTIGIPEWSGAEGLSLGQAYAAITKATGENHGTLLQIHRPRTGKAGAGKRKR